MPKRDEKYMAKKRREILVGAIRCFAENGFDGTTMNDICDKTGLSVGAIYRHFKSKRDIIRALPELSASLRKEVVPETPEALWAEITGELDELLKVDPAIFRLNAQYALECARDPELKSIYSDMLEAREKYILNCLRGMQSRGTIQNEYNVDTGAYSLIFITDGGNLRLLSGAASSELHLKKCLAREFSLMTGRDWSIDTELPRQQSTFSFTQLAGENEDRAKSPAKLDAK